MKTTKVSNYVVVQTGVSQTNFENSLSRDATWRRGRTGIENCKLNICLYVSSTMREIYNIVCFLNFVHQRN